MGVTVGGGAQVPADFTWYLSQPDFSKGSVTFARTYSAGGVERFCWEIIEYIGASGGANEIKVRSVGAATYVNTGLTVNGSSTSVSNKNKVAVFITGQNSIENSSPKKISGGQSTADWDSTSSLPVFTRGVTQTSANSLSYAVVEFTGANWSVQRVEHNFSAAGVTETQAITDVGTTTRAFFHAQFRRTGSDAFDNAGPEIWLASSTQADFLLDSNANNPTNKYSVLWIVSNSDTGMNSQMKVQHLSGQRNPTDISDATGLSGSKEDEWHLPITAVGDITDTSIMGENGRSAGTGSTVPVGWISLYLYTTTSTKLYQSDDSEIQNYRFQIVEWPKAGTIMGGEPGYRFFNNIDSTLPGTALAAQNATATLASTGAAFRLRMLINVTSTNPRASLAQNGQNFFLQFASKKNGICDTNFINETYENITSNSLIAFNKNPTSTDGAALTATTSDPTDAGNTIVDQNYKSSNPFTNAVNAITAGQDGLWDFSLKDNGAPGGSTYCFRIINDTHWNFKNNISYDTKTFPLPSYPYSLNFSTDGSKMYIVNSVNHLDQYVLTTPWDITTASYNTPYFDHFNADIGSVMTPVDIAWRSDGKKIYALSTDKAIYQYSLQTAWDLSTAIYDNASTSLKSQAGPTNSPWALAFSNDGGKMYMSTLTGAYLYQYTLATNWDITTASYDNVHLYFSTYSAAGITFNADGTKMYLAGGAIPGTVILSDANPSWFQKIWALVSSPLHSIWPHLSTANAQGAGGSGGISEYSLSTPWDIRSAILDVGLTSTDMTQKASTEAIAFNGDGNKFYYLQDGVTNYGVYEYTPVTALNTYLDTYSAIPELTTAPAGFGTLIQKNYHWYRDVNTKDPSVSDSITNENTAMANLPSLRRRHLRINVQSPGSFPAGQVFRLQWQKSTTTAAWTNVGAGDFTGYNYSCCTSGASTTILLLSSSTVTETFEEGGVSASTTNAIGAGKAGEWDWVLYNLSTAASGTPYYFRMVGSDYTPFATYVNYPSLTVLNSSSTNGYVTSVIYDTGSVSGSQLNSFYWEGPQPQTGDTVRFQFASASTTAPIGGWDALYEGPDGTASTWYTPSGPSIVTTINPADHKNHRYFRYKVRIDESSGISPVVNRIVINWSP